MKLTMKSAFALTALTLLCGCATSRSVVSLTDAKSSAAATAIESNQGPAVKIVDVQDKRVFLLRPESPNLPSLKDGAINDKAITSRAIARKRNGYGQGLGDVLLPEGDTVANHVSAALADGFRQAGYRVLSPGDAGYDAATPVAAQVLQYWTWMDVGVWAQSLQCETEIQLDTALPALKNTPKIATSTRNTMFAVTESAWQAAASRGLQNIAAKLAESLKANQNVSQLEPPHTTGPS